MNLQEKMIYFAKFQFCTMDFKQCFATPLYAMKIKGSSEDNPVTI